MFTSKLRRGSQAKRRGGTYDGAEVLAIVLAFHDTKLHRERFKRSIDVAENGLEVVLAVIESEAFVHALTLRLR